LGLDVYLTVVIDIQDSGLAWAKFAGENGFCQRILD
jgi:hypothetical protein